MIRLVKVAKELNVGTSTIVEHLQKNGFEVENNPRTKVSDEMYQLLLRDFQNSIEIKNRADQLTIGTRIKRKDQEDGPHTDTEEKTVPPQEEETAEPAKEEPVKEVEVKEETPEPVKEEPVKEVEVKEETPEPIKEEPVKEEAPAKEEPVKEEAPAKEKKVELKKPTVLGKIDLDAVSGKKGTKEKPPKKKEEAPPKEEVKEEPLSKKEPVVKEEEKPVAKETKEPEVKEETPKVEVKDPPKKEEPKVKEPEKKEKGDPAPEKEKEEKAEPEASKEFRAKTPTLKGLKIKGKISLDRISKPKKKKKEEEPKKEGVKKTTGKENEKGKKEGQGSSEEPRKRRRKRKKIVKPSTQGGGSGRSNNKKGGSGKKKDDTPEVSQKEIEEKIKATLARISGRGKNKRSKIRREEREKRREKQEQIDKAENEASNKLQVTEFISVSEFAGLMNVSATEVITACMNVGIFVSINQRLDAEVIELVGEEFGYDVEFISAEEVLEVEDEEIVDNEEDLEPRAPIVTVMGHVDHGKTSLLDFIRNANIASGEAGGITQHIGAYEVKVGEDNRRITFLDTPGHEAFTAMRARGAKVTDVAVIIIAADDSVMPQTKEAISHAQAAGVPIVFAINKVDKNNAQPEKIKQELASMNLLVEDWGGDIQSQDISAKTGLGIDELLEKILLEADLLELKANPNRLSSGVVLEASLDKGRGYVAKILVQTGTLKIGDSVVAGAHFGKIKAMFNERGKRVKIAGPSAPVLVLGMKGAPQAGEKFKVLDTEQEARSIATKHAQIISEQARRAQRRLSLEDIGRRLALGSFKELNLIIKGDFDGSVEALTDSMQKLGTETVQVNIVHKAVGQIIESDVLLASASDAIIIGFQVRPSSAARKLAEKEGVQIKLYSVIYHAIEEITSAIEGMLEPTREEKITGSAEVREVYKISKIGTVAGCYVSEGKMSRNLSIRLIREGIVIYPTKEGVTGSLGSLKRFKEDAKEVKSGLECGLTIENFNDIKVGDVVESYEIVEIKQTL